MRPALLLLSPFLAALLLIAAWNLRKPEREPASPTPAPATASAPADIATVAEPSRVPAHGAFAPEDVFRRAFWRHPTRTDKVLHAERIESPDSTGAVASWRWFLAVEPSADLLAALRSSATFGLRRVESVDLANSAPRPEWFPASAAPADFEILRSPTSGLTVLYRAKDNLLYATDQGAGFAAPSRPL